MPAAYSQITIRDGNGAVIPGGIGALDVSGTGLGPWNFGQVIIDGAAGANRLQVDSSGRIQENTAGFAGVALGSTAIVNYGSTPAAAPVPAVNAFVTNTAAISGTVTANQGGAWTVGQSGTWTVQPGNTPNTSPWLTTQTPATSGGLTTFRLLSAATTNASTVKASPGQVFGWALTNANTASRVVKLYNKASNPVVGTDTPFMTLVIPGGSAGAGMIAAEYVNGIAFSTGIALAITALVADSDTTAVALNDVVVNLFFK